jgi:hypothetical protein
MRDRNDDAGRRRPKDNRQHKNCIRGDLRSNRMWRRRSDSLHLNMANVGD